MWPHRVSGGINFHDVSGFFSNFCIWELIHENTAFDVKTTHTPNPQSPWRFPEVSTRPRVKRQNNSDFQDKSFFFFKGRDTPFTTGLSGDRRGQKVKSEMTRFTYSVSRPVTVFVFRGGVETWRKMHEHRDKATCEVRRHVCFHFSNIEETGTLSIPRGNSELTWLQQLGVQTCLKRVASLTRKHDLLCTTQ